MRGQRFLRRLKLAFSRDEFQPSYSQCGEDLIIRAMLNLLGIENPTYLDIGAHHPTELSNTFLFYRNGSRGVCVEPDPRLIPAFLEKRPGDTVLNVGIASSNAKRELDFYVFDDPSLSTFSKEVKEEQNQAGRRLKQTLTVEVVPINDVLEKHFAGAPNLISLDTEGMDLAILQNFDFGRYRPHAFCIETLTNLNERKMPEIIEFMVANGYMVYADTYINTIFVDRARWDLRLKALNSASDAGATRPAGE